MSFDGNPRLTAITVYSPTEAAPAEEAEDFHNTLRQAMNDVPAHHLLMTFGDMNARLGKENDDDPRWYFHDRTNRNGGLLRDTALECNMEITNTRFKKRIGKMWTHLSDGTLNKGQLDFVLVRQKWKNSVKNTEAYDIFNSLGSDHRVVVSRVKISLRKTKKPPQRVQYDYSALKRDEELQRKYAVAVQNRFSCLVEEGDDATESYGKLVAAVEAANKTLLSKRTNKKKYDPSSDRRVDAARRELFLAKDKYHHHTLEENREEVAVKKEALKSCYLTVEEEILQEKIRKVEESADRCRNKESWELINDISGRTRTCCGLTEGSSPAERLNNWKKHFAGLLGQPPSVPDANITIRNIHPPLDIDINPFTPEELAQAKKQIVEGKAFGDDGISPEVMKRVDLDEIILKFCNDALTKGEIPDQWKLSNIIPVPKKGDLTKTDNYRGISLTSIVCKTLNRMVLNRIKPRLEEVLRDNQNGFRPGRSTTSHILALRRIIEGAKAKNLKATMVFIDFKKAFDSVHRGLLMKILRSYGIPDTIVRLIDNVYTGTVAKVLTAEGCTEVFDILAGVLQGDTLAPYLFIIVIDYIMTVAIDDNETEHGFTLKPAQSRRVVSETVTDVEFADDVALVTDSIEAAQNLLGRLETAASSVGLTMNDGKTEFLTVNTPDEEANIKSSSGRQLKHVKDFKYLGSWIATTEKDIRTRKAKAWAACHKLMKVWKSNLRRSMKIRLFVATVESILLYGSETWTLTESLSKQIDGCYTRMLRMALDVNWKQHLTNKEVYGTLPRATMKIQERRMRLAGHLQRHPELTASSLLLWEPKHGARTRGRPALTYVDNLRKDTGLSDTREIAGLMADRLLWRRHINARTLKPPQVKSIGELVLVSLYCHLCTITPVTLIVWNTFRRWRQQTHSIRTRTPIYSSTCIACLWVLVMCTFLPADFILIGHLLVKQGFITNTIHNSNSEPNLLLSENLKYISDFVKYIFVGLFPVFLLTSKQFRGILAIAAHRKWQNLVKHIGKFLKAETDKRCSVISVTSTGGPQRSFSVVINEHHLCLHSSVVHDHCPRSQLSAPAEDPNRARENFQLAVELPMKVHYHPTIRNDERKISESSEDLAAIDIQSLKIDLHQLHTAYDEFCQSCVREKFVKDSKRKKVVKLRPGKLIHDEGKKIKVGAEKDKSLKYQVEGKSFKVNKKAGADAPNTVDIRETVTSLGENQLDVQSYQTEKSISSVGSLLALVE